MSIEHRAISPLRQRMIEDMCLRKLSEKTQSGYIRWVKHFAAFLGGSPATAKAEDLRRYQLHLCERGVSRISLNAAITALRFLFEVTLGRGELMEALVVTLAKSMTVREVARLLGVSDMRVWRTADGQSTRSATVARRGDDMTRIPIGCLVMRLPRPSIPWA